MSLFSTTANVYRQCENDTIYFVPSLEKYGRNQQRHAQAAETCNQWGGFLPDYPKWSTVCLMDYLRRVAFLAGVSAHSIHTSECEGSKCRAFPSGAYREQKKAMHVVCQRQQYGKWIT